MALIPIGPRPDASATAAPDMPAKIRAGHYVHLSEPEAQMADQDGWQKSKSVFVMPPMFIRLPVNMNSGTPPARGSCQCR